MIFSLRWIRCLFWFFFHLIKNIFLVESLAVSSSWNFLLSSIFLVMKGEGGEKGGNYQLFLKLNSIFHFQVDDPLENWLSDIFKELTSLQFSSGWINFFPYLLKSFEKMYPLEAVNFGKLDEKYSIFSIISLVFTVIFVSEMDLTCFFLLANFHTLKNLASCASISTHARLLHQFFGQ